MATNTVPDLASGLQACLKQTPGCVLRRRTMALRVELDLQMRLGAGEHGGLPTSIQAERM